MGRLGGQRSARCILRVEVKSDLKGGNIPLDAKRDMIHRGDFERSVRHGMVS